MQQCPKLSIVLFLLMALGTCGLLVSCVDAPPTSTVASAVPATPSTVTSHLVPTPTSTLTARAVADIVEPAMPARTASDASPTAKTFTTPVLVPSDTDGPAEIPSPTATGTPVATSSPAPTPTLPPTPVSSPQPEERLQVAFHHQANGEYDQAIAIYLDLLEGSLTVEQIVEAHYHLAESFLLNGNFDDAVVLWEAFVDDYPDDPRLPHATLMLARAYHAAQACAQAIPHYRSYLHSESVLADMVQGWLGDCLGAEGDLEAAIGAYQQGLAATDDKAAQFDLRKRIASAYLALEDYEAAVAQYEAMLPLARYDYQRADVEYLAGQALAAASEMEAALHRYRRIIEAYPKADSAYLSLIELLDAGLEVDEFQRGLVDYWAGENHPDATIAAIWAFDRYLSTKAPEKAAEALYHKAKAHRALGEANIALATLDGLIADHPNSEWQIPARMEAASIHAWLGRNDEAVEIYQDVAQNFPAHPLADQALWEAAKLREREGAYAQAALIYEDLHASFPDAKDAQESLWRAGLAYYRAGTPEKAVVHWRRLVDTYATSSYRGKSLYWLGKLGARPQSQEDASYWDQLVAETPNIYYALRVNQVRAGESLTATRFITDELNRISWSEAEAQEEVLAWLCEWAQAPATMDSLMLPTSHLSSPAMERGAALLAIGLRKEAVDAFDRVRASAWDNPVLLAQLAFFLRELGFHGLAARAALRVAALWPQGTIYNAPLALQRLAYPLAYAELLSTEAQKKGLDPLILASLIRQESLFEPSAESYAGARGLGQVMPATGEGIARSLDMEDFAVEDLYRPAISVQFAAYYLTVQLDRFDDQILVALAAYNGGPGNTARWLESAGDDLDLFVEVITADQSRVYLQRVYQGYMIYERLYRPVGSTGK